MGKSVLSVRGRRIRALSWMFLAVILTGSAGRLHASRPNDTWAQVQNDPVIDHRLQVEMASYGLEHEMTVWIFFTDKGLHSEAEYLQACQIEDDSIPERVRWRRSKVKESTLVDFRDLPVLEGYVHEIEAMGARHRTTTRWFNGISVEVQAGMLEPIAALPFVRGIELVARYRRSPMEVEPLSREKERESIAQLDYGSSLAQLQQIHVPAVHDLGYSGKGVLVCMLDTGFNRHHEALQHIDLIAEWDFINDDADTRNEDGDPLNQHNHGTYTLSALGGMSSGHLYGPAYGAGFLLGKTEDVSDEQPIEEDYWVEGMEWAEAHGADVVSSSLGYLDWYTYEDMDGNTAVTTRAADLAAERGVVVCTAAGNERNGSWHYIIAPADGDSVIACGAVNSSGVIASFSSAGPTSDGRTKPEVVARGVATVCASPSDSLKYLQVSGTSLSTPLVGGAVALILEAHPDWTPMQIREALMTTASRADHPDTLYGWGIINVLAAIQGPCQMELTSPDGTEIWCAGEAGNVTWISDSGGAVRIDYSWNGGTTWQTVTDSTADDGAYVWAIPATPSENTIVRVCDLSDPQCCDQNDTPFAVCAAPTANFKGSPRTDSGETCQVQFTDITTGCVSGWRWDFGDGRMSTLRNPYHEYACGSFYTVTLTVSGPCGSDTEIKSEYIFCDCPCGISVTVPAGGEIWCSDQLHELRWTSQYTSGSVRIAYSTDKGVTRHTVADSTPDDGSFVWIVPRASSSDCLLWICDVSGQGCCAASKGAFRICECESIIFTNPQNLEGTAGCPFDMMPEVNGGCPPYAWSLASGALPEGIILDMFTGRIAGTPTQAGSCTCTVQVADVLEHSAVQICTVHIAEYAQRKGDVNADCAIDILDVVAVVNFILSIDEPDSDEIWRSDCNGPAGQCQGDGLVNVMDAIKMVNIILGADACP